MSDTEKQHPADETEPTESAADEPRAEEAEPTLEEQLAAARDEAGENYDQMLRARAELDNFRKRTQKELQELRQFQTMSLIRDLLPSLDNLGRAIDAAAETGSGEGLVEGVKMVRQQLLDTLSNYSVRPIKAEGEAFDPNLHEAVQQLPSAEHPPMTVLQEVEPGYTLHDRVVRPSKVIVSSGQE